MPNYMSCPKSPHVALRTLALWGCEALPHLPYTPDLPSTDYHLFRHLDLSLVEKQFGIQEMVENAVKQFNKSKNAQFSSKEIHDFVSLWQKCVDADRAYFDSFWLV